MKTFRVFPTALVVVAVSFATACSDEPPRLTEPAVKSTSAKENSGQPTAAPQAQLDRKDTPWNRMSDASLRVEVERAGGRVLIGLKNPDASEGVDNSGRVLFTMARMAEARARIESLGAQVEFEFDRFPVLVAYIAGDRVGLLRSDAYVDYLEPVTSGQWSQQVTPWGVSQVQAPLAWSLSTGTGVKLLIIDSGVMGTHPDLSTQVAWRCINGNLPISDQIGHGTHVAGTAAALNNQIHVVGVAPNVHLMSANVEVNAAPNSAEVACSINVARLNNVFVANMSLSLFPSTAVTDQINNGYTQNGMLFVAAAGNTNGGAVSYPANLANVMAVTATTPSNTRAPFAAIGPQIEIAAPGVDILSTSLPTGFSCASGGLTAQCSGTSMAAPHVAAAAALVKARYPSWTNVQVRNRLTSTALPLGPTSQFGAGLLQSLAAVQ